MGLPFSPPTSVLIVGSGVFGLSTALALARRREFAHASITVVDRSTDPDLFPARDAASVDTSRIVRADYSDPAYASLAAEAQEQWRTDDLGGEGRYTECGLVLVADAPPSTAGLGGKKTGMDYVKSSWENVAAMVAAADGSNHLRLLPTPEAIREAVGTGGASGSWGYCNQGSGWADADASMRWLHRRVRREGDGRVRFVSGTVTGLRHQNGRVTAAELVDGSVLSADLTIVSAGAWTGTLVDLAGRAAATGQVLAYMDLTEEEQAVLSRMPVLLNMTSGLFVIPPAGRVLKIARHAFGYLNPTLSTHPLPVSADAAPAAQTTISVPLTHVTQPSLAIPAEGEAALRSALKEMAPLPALQDRPFAHTRLCWYSDTPTGDFLIDYHPSWEGLFIATGDSGHGFKFLPVIGDKIVDCVLGKRPAEFDEKWAWKKTTPSSTTSWDVVITEDGSRGGIPRLLLQEEMAKTRV